MNLRPWQEQPLLLTAEASLWSRFSPFLTTSGHTYLLSVPEHVQYFLRAAHHYSSVWNILPCSSPIQLLCIFQTLWPRLPAHLPPPGNLYPCGLHLLQAVFPLETDPQLCIAHLKPRVLWPMWVPIICPPKSPPGLLRTQLCLVAQPMGNPGFPLALGPFTIAAWACEDGTHRCVVPHPWAWQEEEAETLERGGCYSWPHLLGVLPSNSFSHQPGLTLGLSTKLTQVHFASL